MSWKLPFIAANWKLNHGPAETRRYLGEFLPAIGPLESRTVALFPPSLSLTTAVEVLADRSDILLGVQNLYWESSGAFTGEISASLARDAGARVALVGHSERRHLFGESDEDVARKIASALEAQLTPVLCVGETLEEREAGRAREVVARQLETALSALAEPPPGSLLVAYEPVWAIGTGRTASPADAGEMHREIRALLARLLPPATAASTPILYGGSVKPDNASELLTVDQVDGLLVGGASLEPRSFRRICEAPT